MVKRLIALMMLVLMVSATAHMAIDSSASQRAVVASLEKSDYEDAEIKLKRIRSDCPSEFTENNLDYALARVLQRNKKLTEAKALYEAVLSKGSNLVPYAFYHLAEIARSQHQLAVERGYLDKLLKQN